MPKKSSIKTPKLPLSGLNFHLTGNDPHKWEEVGNVVDSFGGSYTDPYTLPDWPDILRNMDAGVQKNQIPGFNQGLEYLKSINYIVIGKENFHKYFLEFSLNFYRKLGFEYISQETFLDLVKNKVARSYWQNDPRIKTHPGLAYLTKIGFKWPSTETQANYLYLTRDRTDNLAEISDLRLLGYSVGQTKSVQERRRALRTGVTLFGLCHVASKVAWLARMRKGRSDNIMEDAIASYEDDLMWLKMNFYDDTRFDFMWPSTKR